MIGFLALIIFFLHYLTIRDQTFTKFDINVTMSFILKINFPLYNVISPTAKDCVKINLTLSHARYNFE